MKEVEKKEFVTVKDLYYRFVQPMNEAYGSEFFTIKWCPDSIYLSVKCRAQGCPFKIEFCYDKHYDSHQPTDLKWRRTVTASHHIPSHDACRLTKMKNSLDDYK